MNYESEVLTMSTESEKTEQCAVCIRVFKILTGFYPVCNGCSNYPGNAKVFTYSESLKGYYCEN